MTQAPSEPARDDASSPAARVVGILLLVIAIGGLLLHAGLYFSARPEWVADYVRGPGIKTAAGVAFANLVASWFHYRRAPTGSALAARIVTYVWVLSIIVLLRAAYGTGPGGG